MIAQKITKLCQYFALLSILALLMGCAPPDSPTPLAYYLHHGDPYYGYSPYIAGYNAGTYYTHTTNHENVMLY